MKDSSWLPEVALAFLRKKYVDFYSFVCLITRKYPLHEHILGMLTHITTLDIHRGGDETLN